MSFPGPESSAPTAVRVSFVLVAASVVATVVSLVLTFAHADELARVVGDATGAGFDEGLRSSAVFHGICCSALMLLGVQATRGRNWARVLLTALAVFTVLAGFVSGDARYPAMIIFAVMVAQVLQVGTVIALWLPTSNEFFQRVGTARAVPSMDAYVLRLR
ncbi:hypothetical protein [Allokutzneria albata]|uniref:Uncharacterized protein n=1 Tax=Allokutzneria albata TaxID=211114 RepID=A0A1G9Z2Q6_ALLAB|nr:hypothetical protein [Allokutzneria albata]SDN15051.1 hypothetical protein SAMN04489726_5196 [Allokutzneria albata]